MSSSPRGAFFRTMVLMGSSVALSCGGSTQDDGTGGASGSGGTDGTGGADTGTGGASGGSTGGTSVGTGGTVVIGVGGGTTGGAFGMGGFGGAYPMDCPTTQLSCVPQGGSSTCSSVEYGYLRMPANCECDPERPATEDDCEQDETLVCLGATQSWEGETLDPVVPYNCECVPMQPYPGCHNYCPEHSMSGGSVYCSEPDYHELDLDAYLCGCALTILK